MTLVLVVLIASACAETPRSVPTAPGAAAAATTTAPATTTAASTVAGSTRPPTVTSSVSPSRAPTASPSARPSGAAGASAAPTSGASLPAMPALPTLPSGARAVASGTLSFTLGPGETRAFDASIGSVTPPPCPSLVWVAAWRATDPVAGTVVLANASRMDLGTGRWGTADMGCASVELRNPGSATVSGELLYNIASR